MPRRDPWSYIGIFAFFALLLVALFGERIAPHEAIYFVLEHGRDPRPYDPGLVFPFGSDVLGRDLFSLVLAGARPTLVIVLLSGVARVVAGLLIAAVGTWSRSVRILTDSLGELVSAVPATLVALILIKVFVRADTTILVFIGAVLVTGWAGPYRVIRAELDRLALMPFTLGAAALGVGRVRILLRHHVPHLVPLLAINTSQQVIASLVLIAELGVIGAFVGATRSVNIAASLTIARAGPLGSDQISELSEWGGLLANTNARSIDSLWTTRWLFLVPGIAFAVTAVAVAAVAFALARRYARRDVLQDLRRRAAAALAIAVVAVFAASAVVPERYAGARDWANAARAEVRPESDLAFAFAQAGLRSVGGSWTVERDTTQIVKVRPASVAVGGATAVESATPVDVRPFVYAGTGGGQVEAPLVFVGRGVSPADYPPQARTSVFSPLDLGSEIARYTDDYSGVDVRGKVVLLVKFRGVTGPGRVTIGPSVDTSIANAVKRGAAAVLFVDAELPRYVNTATSFVTPTNPYRRLEIAEPVTSPAGVPVVVLSLPAAEQLVASTGLSVTPFADWLQAGSEATTHSASRDLGVRAKVEVSLERASAHVRSVVGEVADLSADIGRIVVWGVRRNASDHAAADVLAALARELVPRHAPFIFVEFDPSVDPTVNSQSVADALKGRRIALMLILENVDGSELRFSTPFGELVPAIDLYADKASARHAVTRTTQLIDTWQWTGSRPFFERKAIVIAGSGGSGDLRGDAAALIGYLAGRRALGAEELPR
jgi:peptide/nickel transport system permease protein